MRPVNYWLHRTFISSKVSNSGVYHTFRIYDNYFDLGYTVSVGGIYKFVFYWGCLGNVVFTWLS